MIIVMSDSHTERAVIENIKNTYAGKAAAIFHCGDSELPRADKIWEGVTVVAGNCDYDEDYAQEEIREIDGKRIFMTHGHLQNINLYGLKDLEVAAKNAEADIVLFGHIHRPAAEIIDNRLFLNPGSVSQPRGEWKIKMYAVLEWTNSSSHTLYNVSYRTLDHEPIAQLQFSLEVL